MLLTQKIKLNMSTATRSAFSFNTNSFMVLMKLAEKHTDYTNVLMLMESVYFGTRLDIVDTHL